MGATRGAVPRTGADADPGAGRLAHPRSCVCAGPPDWQGDEHHMEPDTEEGGCAGVNRCRPKQCGHEDRRRMDGGGSAQPDGGDGDGAPVLQPEAQDLDGGRGTLGPTRPTSEALTTTRRPKRKLSEVEARSADFRE